MSSLPSRFRSSSNPNKLERNFYKVWGEMKRRCAKPTSVRNTKAYFDKGIKVSPRWMNFEYFFIDMWDSYLLHRELNDSTELDRIDNNKGYNKSNCRWVTRTENLNNRGDYNVKIRGKSFSEWSKILGIPRGTLVMRHFLGENEDRILYPGKLTSLRKSASRDT